MSSSITREEKKKELLEKYAGTSSREFHMYVELTKEIVGLCSYIIETWYFNDRLIPGKTRGIVIYTADANKNIKRFVVSSKGITVLRSTRDGSIGLLSSIFSYARKRITSSGTSVSRKGVFCQVADAWKGIVTNIMGYYPNAKTEIQQTMQPLLSGYATGYTLSNLFNIYVDLNKLRDNGSGDKRRIMIKQGTPISDLLTTAVLTYSDSTGDRLISNTKNKNVTCYSILKQKDEQNVKYYDLFFALNVMRALELVSEREAKLAKKEVKKDASKLQEYQNKYVQQYQTYYQANINTPMIGNRLKKEIIKVQSDMESKKITLSPDGTAFLAPFTTATTCVPAMQISVSNVKAGRYDNAANGDKQNIESLFTQLEGNQGFKQLLIKQEEFVHSIHNSIKGIKEERVKEERKEKKKVKKQTDSLGKVVDFQGSTSSRSRSSAASTNDLIFNNQATSSQLNLPTL
jgi:uncharacterized protein (DUF305 family)